MNWIYYQVCVWVSFSISLSSISLFEIISIILVLKIVNQIHDENEISVFCCVVLCCFKLRPKSMQWFLVFNNERIICGRRCSGFRWNWGHANQSHWNERKNRSKFLLTSKCESTFIQSHTQNTENPVLIKIIGGRRRTSHSPRIIWKLKSDS